MRDKYYTPEIEEFHVGFEYEMFFPNGKYHKQTFGDKITHLELEEFKDDLMKVAHAISRVKHLDKEDIESLGFNHIGSLWFRDKDDDYRATKVRKWKNNELDIYINDSIEDVLVFRGTIKNKSELKTVLKQIGHP